MRRCGLVLAGAYLCVVAAIVHRHTVGLGGTRVPWGLVLALVATAAVVLAASELVRVGGAWLGLGWAAMLTALQLSPGGSYLVATDWMGLTFAAGSLVLIVWGALRTPRRGQ
ncbi:hypothetical protein GCM10022234_06490 [Aeromicrobium panaciterrae]|uniref:hypothetical protein n=1 Tax=Aeromicrobium panaciterrae TaxID=363861 RepID=UPI0031DB81C9